MSLDVLFLYGKLINVFANIKSLEISSAEVFVSPIVVGKFACLGPAHPLIPTALGGVTPSGTNQPRYTTQGRIGMYVPQTDRDTAIIELEPVYRRVLRRKVYELKDHLGNVRVVFTDLKLIGSGGNGASGPWDADVVSYNNYYAFGMVQPGRHGNTEGYR